MTADRQQLDNAIEIVTPENIAFRYQAAGPFRRLPAYLIDLLIRGMMFVGGTIPCFDSCDANDDGSFNLADAVFILAGQFTGGAPPSAPYPLCGLDPTPDGLDCVSFPACP